MTSQYDSLRAGAFLYPPAPSPAPPSVPVTASKASSRPVGGALTRTAAAGRASSSSAAAISTTSAFKARRPGLEAAGPYDGPNANVWRPAGATDAAGKRRSTFGR